MEIPTCPAPAGTAFEDATRRALYRTIFSRRDIRGQFTPAPIPEDVLSRILLAAHYAPSVGFMQPWSFIVIRADETRRKIHSIFEAANREAAGMFEGEARETYRNLKLEGIRDAPVNLCVTCDRARAGPVVLGRTHVRATDIYSTVCAVQNLWLAARAEGLGLGWVSILDQRRLKRALGIPKGILPVAYLCLGYVSHFPVAPELEAAGWRSRLPLADLLAFERFGGAATDRFAKTLLERVRMAQGRVKDEGSDVESEW